jgi:hypothetical protein
MIGASDDELKLLVAKQYIIPFESGVVVIKHWKIHNYIQKDRYHPSQTPEKQLVEVNEKTKAYELVDTTCIQGCIQECIQDGNIGKVRLGKDRLDNIYIPEISSDDGQAKPKTPRKKAKDTPKVEFAEAVTMTQEEHDKLKEQLGSVEAVSWCINKLNNYKLSSGKKYKSDYRAILSWVIDSLPPQLHVKQNAPTPTFSIEEQEKRRREKQSHDDMLAALAEGGTNG